MEGKKKLTENRLYQVYLLFIAQTRALFNFLFFIF